MSERNVKWTDRALHEYDQLIDHLWEDWGEKVTIKVSVKIEKSILRLTQSPGVFAFVNKAKRVQRCVVSNQTSIFFTVSSEFVVILSVFNNRQNPANLDF